jgi:hypothetical protein
MGFREVNNMTRTSNENLITNQCPLFCGLHYLQSFCDNCVTAVRQLSKFNRMKAKNRIGANILYMVRF